VLQRLNRMSEQAARLRGSVKISLNSQGEGLCRLRCAVKGGQPGLLAGLCEQAGLQIHRA
jgi:hypothetical protein